MSPYKGRQSAKAADEPMTAAQGTTLKTLSQDAY